MIYKHVFKVLLVLLILLIIFYNNPVISSIISYIIIFFLLVPFIKDPIILFFTTFIIILLLSIQTDKTQHILNYEHLSNKNDNDITEEIEDDIKKKSNNQLNSNINRLVEQLSTIDDDKAILQKSDLIDNNNININELDPIIESNIENDKKPKEDLKINEMEPYQAQKETFHLINSVENLQNTVKTLAPLLREGKRVLDLYKNFKF